MKSRFLLVILAAAALSSCTSVYKSGQTPDDVYYSPARGGEEYVEARKEDNRRYRSYEYDDVDDRWLRMRVRNPYRWNAFDNYDFFMPNSWATWNSPYSYNWNSYWNNYWGWNSFYNPYCFRTIVVNPKSNPIVYNNVRTFSLNGYTRNNYNNTNNIVRTKGAYRSTSSGYNNNNGSGYNNSNQGTLGNSLRKVFSNSGSNSGGGYTNGNTYTPSSNDRPVRSYTPSSGGGSSSGSSSGSSGSSGGSVSRPGRGGL